MFCVLITFKKTRLSLCAQLRGNNGQIIHIFIVKLDKLLRIKLKRITLGIICDLN